MKTIRAIFPDITLLGLVIVLVVGLSLAYVSSERYFYFWDFNLYQQMTINQVHLSYTSLLKPVKTAFNSLGEDYNSLFTLPLIPVIRLTGHPSSRLAYIPALSLVYFFPYLLVIGLIAREIFPRRSRIAFWMAVAIGLVTPAAWLPTLRGYPDAGGACLIALATWAYIYDPDLKRWWQAPLIGVSLATAPLFRRHFAYGVTAYLAAVSLTILAGFIADLWRKQSGAVRLFLMRGARLGLALLVSLGVLLTIGRLFVMEVLAKKSQLLYTAWQTTPLTVLRSFRVYYGWLGLLLASLGLGVGLLVFTKNRQRLAFVTLFGGVSIAQWLLWVRQPNPQYSLHFTYAILLGLTALTWVIWAKLKGIWRAAVSALLAAYLGVNATFGLAPQSFGKLANLRILLADQTGPLQRSDYSQIVRLINDLHAQAARWEPVYVIGSSGTLNYSLLQSADQILYPGHTLSILYSPEITIRDPYPIEALLKAHYIVIGYPLQLHLASKEQEVLSIAYKAFSENWEAAQDFVRLPETFSLAGDVQVEIYQRIRPTELDVALRTAARIRAGVSSLPPNQPNWVQMDGFDFAWLSKNQNSRLRVNLKEASADISASFLSLAALPARGSIGGQVSVKGTGCEEIHLSLATGDSDGDIAPFGEISARPEEVQPFSFSFQTQGTTGLLLTLSTPGTSANPCTVIIEGLDATGGN